MAGACSGGVIERGQGVRRVVAEQVDDIPVSLHVVGRWCGSHLNRSQGRVSQHRGFCISAGGHDPVDRNPLRAVQMQYVEAQKTCVSC